MARTIASAGVGGKAWPGQLHPRELEARRGQDSCIQGSWRQSMARTIASTGVGIKVEQIKAMLIVWSIDHGDGDGLSTRCCG